MKMEHEFASLKKQFSAPLPLPPLPSSICTTDLLCMSKFHLKYKKRSAMHVKCIIMSTTTLTILTGCQTCPLKFGMSTMCHSATSCCFPNVFRTDEHSRLFVLFRIWLILVVGHWQALGSVIYHFIIIMISITWIPSKIKKNDIKRITFLYNNNTSLQDKMNKSI